MRLELWSGGNVASRAAPRPVQICSRTQVKLPATVESDSHRLAVEPQHVRLAQGEKATDGVIFYAISRATRTASGELGDPVRSEGTVLKKDDIMAMDTLKDLGKRDPVTHCHLLDELHRVTLECDVTELALTC